MEARAVLKFKRVSPRKMRLVLDTIRSQPVATAFARLSALPKRAARIAEDLLKSAVGNARVLRMNEERLVVASCRADNGPIIKRFLPRAMGRASDIHKRTSHVTITVGESAKAVRGGKLPPSRAAAAEGGKAASRARAGKKAAAAAAGAA